MTAYVHIGTEKTGSTSIQFFLYSNRRLLQRQNMIYPISIGNYSSQWNFTFLAYNNLRNDFYCLSKGIFKKDDFLHHKKDIFLKFKDELLKSKCEKVVISSEHLSSRIQDLSEIKRIRKILYLLGFKKIKIIVYIREQTSDMISSFSTTLKSGAIGNIQANSKKYFKGYHKLLLLKWQQIFGKENLIVRLFDKSEFYQGDLLKDFVHSIGLKWDNEFVIPPKQNESLDLIGVELLKRINQYLPWRIDNKINHLRGDLTKFITKYFQNSNNYHLKFQPPKEIIQSYIDSFEESNEWVRKEFFPYKERLFPKQDLANYKENYELKEMKPEYWN
ncbi:hypothetical protein ACSM8R_001902, partial [Campylobacter coli]|nr:hypothetical protein [Campylobacter coli]EAL2746722.1 hypothetical protein [Campylobacter coli]